MLPEGQRVDARKVRIGLAIVSVVVLVALGLTATIDDPLGRIVMLVVALVGVARAYRLFRALKQERAEAG